MEVNPKKENWSIGYWSPNTVKKCHLRIDSLLHNNKVQAEHIAKLQSDLHKANLTNESLKVQLDLSIRKGNADRFDLESLKGVLAMLGRNDGE